VAIIIIINKIINNIYANNIPHHSIPHHSVAVVDNVSLMMRDFYLINMQIFYLAVYSTIVKRSKFRRGKLLLNSSRKSCEIIGTTCVVLSSVVCHQIVLKYYILLPRMHGVILQTTKIF
jgi:tmRNA-binding protein